MAFICCECQKLSLRGRFAFPTLLLEGKQPLLRFDEGIFTTYDGNNCFIIPKNCLTQFIAGGNFFYFQIYRINEQQ
jgi:hypothetical protein